MHESEKTKKLKLLAQAAHAKYIESRQHDALVRDAKAILPMVSGTSTRHLRTTASFSDPRTIAAVEWLSSHGYIEKVQNTTDLRKYVWRLTGSGEKLVATP